MIFSNSSDAKMNYVGTANNLHLYSRCKLKPAIKIDNLNIIISYKRIQGNESEKKDTIKFGVNFK